MIAGHARRLAWLAFVLGCLAGFAAAPALAQVDERSASVYLDFAREQNQVQLHGGARRTDQNGGALAFTTATQFAEISQSPNLEGVKGATVGGWFFLTRAGEQVLVSRGIPDVGENGERFFRPTANRAKFFIGTDQHGFFMGSMNGNSRMPFPLVTLDELSIDAWHQLVVVKEANGIQRFFHNGTQVHTDAEAEAAGVVIPFHDTTPGEPIRLAVPHGGMIGEAWVFPRALTAAEIRADFESKRVRFAPALPVAPVAVREMNAHPAANLWRAPVTKETWPVERARIETAVKKLLGPFPKGIPPLAPIEGAPVDCDKYLRRKVSFQVENDDRMPAWLLVPKEHSDKPLPAIICMYGTTSGAGKDTTVGLSGAKPGTPPRRNRAFAIDMVEAGFVTLAPDWLRDGERIPPSGRPYDTADFYVRHPDWSCVGKDVWDTMRAVDYLQTLPFVDPQKIGMVGHSYGGHTTIFAAAIEPRIAAVFSSGPVSDFLHHGMHWAVDRGGGASQSLPALRPFVLDHTNPLPVTFYEWTSLIAPRPLWVQQAVGERRPMEEENHAAVSAVYRALGVPDRVKYMWQAGDHDFPPEARRAAVAWFKQWFAE
jgi:dienelactone hydrolase